MGLTRRHNSDDLQKFFDRYLKGIENGWEDTPKVRLTMISFTGKDVVERPEPEVRSVSWAKGSGSS